MIRIKGNQGKESKLASISYVQSFAMLKQLVVGLVAAVLVTGLAMAGPFEDASAAYERGDYETSRQLLLPLAERGDAAAQVKLGVMYARGKGVAKDYSEAVRWFRLAAGQGDAIGEAMLAFMYDRGLGVPQDDTEAAKWYRLAAEQDYAPAQRILGVMYGEGWGVQKDDVLAYMWSSLAAAHSEETQAAANRDLAASRMTPDQIAEAERLAREWKPKAER